MKKSKPSYQVGGNVNWCSYHGKQYSVAAAKLLQSCPTLCDPTDGSPPGSPVPGILQARTLEWVAISFSNAWKWKVKVKSCPTLSDPMDCSLPGSSVHGIFQARVLEWVATAFSRKTVWKFFNKLKVQLSYDSAISLPGTYAEKTLIWKDKCTSMFIAALLTVAKTRKQPKYPLTNKWIKKMWDIYSMKY